MSNKSVRLSKNQKIFIGKIRRFTVSHQELNTEALLRTLLEFEESLSNSPAARSQPKAHSKLYKPFKKSLLEAAATIDAYALNTKLVIEQSSDQQTIDWNEMQKGSFYEIFKCAHKAKILLLAITECLHSRDENILLDLFAQTYALGATVQRLNELELKPAADSKLELLGHSEAGRLASTKVTPERLEHLKKWASERDHPCKSRDDLWIELAEVWAEHFPKHTVTARTIEYRLKGYLPERRKILKRG